MLYVTILCVSLKGVTLPKIMEFLTTGVLAELKMAPLVPPFPTMVALVTIGFETLLYIAPPVALLPAINIFL